MKISYKQIKEFMTEYCKDYSQYANDPETIAKMHKYWAPDLVAKAYFRGKTGDSPIIHNSREQFQNSLIVNHQSFRDMMEPLDLIIDEISAKAVLISKITKTAQNSSETYEINGMGCYKLQMNTKKTLFIKSIDFFWDAPEEIKKISL